MKRWERFVSTIDDECEKSSVLDIKRERQIIKELESILEYDIGQAKIEPQQKIVSYGALSRCCLCMESIVALIGYGYIGSANALFRQAYELLCWAKMALDTEDDRISKELHDAFFFDIVNR